MDHCKTANTSCCNALMTIMLLKTLFIGMKEEKRRYRGWWGYGMRERGGEEMEICVYKYTEAKRLMKNTKWSA